MPNDTCPTCGLRHLGRRPCFYDQLRAALGGLEPTAEEDRVLRWLAAFDAPTIDPLVSLFERLRARRAR